MLCRATVRLPMTGRADSLNVGVAAGVMMYELVRRKGTKYGGDNRHAKPSASFNSRPSAFGDE